MTVYQYYMFLCQLGSRAWSPFTPLSETLFYVSPVTVTVHWQVNMVWGSEKLILCTVYSDHCEIYSWYFALYSEHATVCIVELYQTEPNSPFTSSQRVDWKALFTLHWWQAGKPKVISCRIFLSYIKEGPASRCYFALLPLGSFASWNLENSGSNLNKSNIYSLYNKIYVCLAK